MPFYDLKISLLIKSFFNLYFNPIFLYHKYYRSYKARGKSLNKIFTSKAEVKHTNNKAVITVYVYNREKISLLKKIKKLNKNLFNLMAKFAVILHKKEGCLVACLHQAATVRSLQEIFKYEKRISIKNNDNI